MSHLIRAHFGRLHLTFPQAPVLTVLGSEGPMPISTPAQRTGSANSTVSGIVDRPEKLEFLPRARSDDDRRVIYVEATEKYRDLRKQTETDVKGYFANVLDTMPEGEQQEIAAALDKLDTTMLAWESANPRAVVN